MVCFFINKWYNIEVMIEKNVCLFIDQKTNFNSIYPSNFVFETDTEIIKQRILLSTYRIYLVEEGSATLTILDKTFSLKKGDVFIGKPGFTYSFSPDENFKCFYVSFLGNRASYFVDKVSVTPSTCVFRDLNDLIFTWKNALKPNSSCLGVIIESIVLYTFSVIIDKFFSSEKKGKKEFTAEIIKKYLDKNFFIPELSLKIMSEDLAYSQKYLSTTFKQFYNQTITDYLSGLRINHAISLMEHGITVIKNIAELSGFNDALYFSKVFKKITGLSPKQKINSL